MADCAGWEIRVVSGTNSIQVNKGDLTLRLAQGAHEIRACQELRYRVFYEELSAMADSVGVYSALPPSGSDSARHTTPDAARDSG